jgi:hypothetical protein
MFLFCLGFDSGAAGFSYAIDFHLSRRTERYMNYSKLSALNSKLKPET